MSYKVLFSKLAEKEVKNILYIRLIMKYIIFEKWSQKHYIVLYSIKNKTVIIKKVLTQGMNNIKKSAFADFFLMHFYAFMLLFIEDAIYVEGIEDAL